jgi:hypothetical protein
LEDVRVLTLAKSQDRIKHMISVCRDIDKHGVEARKFLFAQAGEFTLKNPGRIFEKVWQNGRNGKLVTLFD